jgi:hypothetical protein
MPKPFRFLADAREIGSLDDLAETVRRAEAIGPDPASITFDGTLEKVGWVRDAAGDRFDDLVLNVYPSGVSRASWRSSPGCATS